jgi:hypothetical protein
MKKVKVNEKKGRNLGSERMKLKLKEIFLPSVVDFVGHGGD